MIPAGVMLLWPGTNASIPTGYTRKTAADNRFLRIASNSSEVLDTGGSATHQHTTPPHAHILNSHTHTFQLSSAAQGSPLTRCRSNALGEVFNGSHSHGTSQSSSHNNGNVTDSFTTGAGDNNPSHRRLILIESSGTNAIPDGVILPAIGQVTAGGFTACNGTGGSTDMDEYFIKSPTTGSNAGSTAGSNTHSHSLNHSHAAKSHFHPNSTTVQQNGANAKGQGGGLVNQVIHTGHTHQVSLANTAVAPQSYTGTYNPSNTVIPAYKRILLVENTSGGVLAPQAEVMCGFWGGSDATIPAGWEKVTTYGNYYLRATADHTKIGQTGGSNTHTHANHTHSHSGTNHTHTGSCSAHIGGQNDNSGNPPFEATNVSTIGQHSVINVSTETATYTSGTVSFNTANNEPLFIKLTLIVKKRFISGGILN